MSDVTRLLDAAAAGDPKAAADLLPLVYDELRTLAAARMAREKPGLTLDATALVHEAYLRLVGPAPGAAWDSRAHFFAAAAEAMRRILVEAARRKRRVRHGAGRVRVELRAEDRMTDRDPDTVLAVDEALTLLDQDDPQAAMLARLHLFVGCSVEEAADALGISRSSAYRDWTYARARLSSLLGDRKSE